MYPVIDDTTGGQRVILRENIEIKFVHAFLSFNKTFQVQLKLALSRSDTSELSTLKYHESTFLFPPLS